MSARIRRPAEASERAAAPSDAELKALFHRLAAGDAGALEAIYDAFGDELYGLALWTCGSPEDAADAVQETFVRLAEAGERLRRVKRPRGYLFTVGRRAALDRVRRKKRRGAEPLPLEPDLLLEEVEPSAASSMHRRLDAAAASRRLASLPQAQRDAVTLRCFTDLSFAEIGEALGIPTFTAASRYRLGVERLRRLLLSTGGSNS